MSIIRNGKLKVGSFLYPTPKYGSNKLFVYLTPVKNPLRRAQIGRGAGAVYGFRITKLNNDN